MSFRRRDGGWNKTGNCPRAKATPSDPGSVIAAKTGKSAQCTAERTGEGTLTEEGSVTWSGLQCWQDECSPSDDGA